VSLKQSKTLSQKNKKTKKKGILAQTHREKGTDGGHHHRNQGASKMASKPPEGRRGLKDSPSQSPEEPNAASALISDFWPPELW
jgi:hypothetical protein